jgi:type IV secretory pathway protease TraF
MSIWASRRSLASWQWLLIFVICGVATALVHRYVRIGVNSTTSIHAKVLVVIRGAMPGARGEYIVFRWQGQGGFHRPGVLFTKIVRGLPGDAVEVAANGFVTVSGEAIGFAKPRASNGTLLEPISPVVIPPGYFFVAGQSEDSLDSRYKVVGLVSKEHVVGKAYAVY